MNDFEIVAEDLDEHSAAFDALCRIEAERDRLRRILQRVRDESVGLSDEIEELLDDVLLP